MFIITHGHNNAQWGRTVKNWDVSTGPLARPFARLVAPLTRSLTPHYSLRSRAPLRSLPRSLAHFAHSLARGTVIECMAIFLCFFFYSGPQCTGITTCDSLSLPAETHWR